MSPHQLARFHVFEQEAAAVFVRHNWTHSKAFAIQSYASRSVAAVWKAALIILASLIFTATAYAQTCTVAAQTEVPFQSVNGLTPSTSINTNATMIAGNSRIQLALAPFGNFVVNPNGISDNHYTGEAGIRLGHVSGQGGDFANRLEATIRFVQPTNTAVSKPVEGLRFRLHDVDASDTVVVNAYDENNNLITIAASNYTLYTGTVVTYAGANRFDSAVTDAASNTRLGTVDLNFSGYKVSRIVFQYWDPLGAGTYTIAEMAACAEAQLTVRKTSIGGTNTFNFTGDNNIAPHSITTVTAGTPAAGTTQVIKAGAVTNVTEAVPPTGYTLTSGSCTGFTGGGSSTFNSATRTVSIPAASILPNNVITCNFTNTYTAPISDLGIAKTNSTTTVTSSGTTTYVLTVTNNGPSTVSGAIVTDTPGAGITCPAGNTVAISGNGVPGGSYTVANLTGSGIALGTLLNGQSATLTYSCQVN